MILRHLLSRSKRRSPQLTEQFSTILRLRRTGVQLAEVVSIENRRMISADSKPAPALTQNAQAAVAVLSTPVDSAEVSGREQLDVNVIGNSSSHELVFIDIGAANYQQLLDGLWSHQAPNRHLDIVLLSPCRDGLSQITEALVLYQTRKLDAVHFIIQGGADRAILLGSTWLDTTSLLANRATITSWSSALNPGADLLIYGCDLAGNDQGRTLLNQLVALTGADFAASIDDSGSTLLGSTWELQHPLSGVKTEVSFCGLSHPEWDTLRNPFPVTNSSDNGMGSLRHTMLDASLQIETPSICIKTITPLIGRSRTGDLPSAIATIIDAVVFGGTTYTDFGRYGHFMIELIGPHAGTANVVPQPVQGGVDSTIRSHQRAVRSELSVRDQSVQLAPSAMQTILPEPILDLATSLLQDTQMWNQLNSFLDRLREPGQESAHLSRRGKNSRQLWLPSAAYVRIVGRKYGNRTAGTSDRSVWLAS